MLRHVSPRKMKRLPMKNKRVTSVQIIADYYYLLPGLALQVRILCRVIAIFWRILYGFHVDCVG